MDLGFDGASMNEIARAAGVSKGTLYVYFADKSRLFEAIVEDEALEQGKIAFNLDPQARCRNHAAEFGQAYIRSLCRPGGGSSIRTVMAIAERMPEVGRQLLRATCWSRRSTVSPIICRRMCRPDDLAIDDCGLAAAQFTADAARRRCFCRSCFRPSRRHRRSASRAWLAARRVMFLTDVPGEAE